MLAQCKHGESKGKASSDARAAGHVSNDGFKVVNPSRVLIRDYLAAQNGG